MIKTWIKPRNKKSQAMEFSKLLNHSYLKQAPFDPPNKLEQSESEIQTQVIDYLNIKMLKGELFFARINNTGIYDESIKGYRAMAPGAIKGFPDIIIVKDGATIYIELKSSIGTQSIDQRRVQELLEAQGAKYYIIRTLKALASIV